MVDLPGYGGFEPRRWGDRPYDYEENVPPRRRHNTIRRPRRRPSYHPLAPTMWEEQDEAEEFDYPCGIPLVPPPPFPHFLPPGMISIPPYLDTEEDLMADPMFPLPPPPPSVIPADEFCPLFEHEFLHPPPRLPFPVTHDPFVRPKRTRSLPNRRGIRRPDQDHRPVTHGPSRRETADRSHHYRHATSAPGSPIQEPRPPLRRRPSVPLRRRSIHVVPTPAPVDPDPLTRRHSLYERARGAENEAEEDEVPRRNFNNVPWVPASYFASPPMASQPPLAQQPPPPPPPPMALSQPPPMPMPQTAATLPFFPPMLPPAAFLGPAFPHMMPPVIMMGQDIGPEQQEQPEQPPVTNSGPSVQNERAPPPLQPLRRNKSWLSNIFTTSSSSPSSSSGSIMDRSMWDSQTMVPLEQALQQKLSIQSSPPITRKLSRKAQQLQNLPGLWCYRPRIIFQQEAEQQSDNNNYNVWAPFSLSNQRKLDRRRHESTTVIINNEEKLPGIVFVSPLNMVAYHYPSVLGNPVILDVQYLPAHDNQFVVRQEAEKQQRTTSGLKRSMSTGFASRLFGNMFQ